MPKQYRLLKDLPNAKVGEKLTEGNFYYLWDDAKKVGYRKHDVENNPTWFEEVVQKEWEWTDELVKEVIYWAGHSLISQEQSADYVRRFKFIKSPSDEASKQLNTTKEESRCLVCGVKIKDGAKYCGNHWEYYEGGRNTSSLPESYGDESPYPSQPQNNKERIVVQSIEKLDSNSKLYGWDFVLPVQYRDKFPAIKQAIEQVLNDETNPELIRTAIDNTQKFQVYKLAYKYTEEDLKKAFIKSRKGILNTIPIFEHKDFEDYKNSLHKS